ncbi:MAG: hypothetical protein RR272_04600 [Synergistaceae bacterium]
MRSYNVNKGTSFVEVMIYLVILGFFIAGIALSFSGGDNGKRAVEKEADKFDIWINGQMEKAISEQCAFDLSFNEAGRKITITFTEGARKGEISVFEFEDVSFRLKEGVQSYSFAGKWVTFTPMSPEIRLCLFVDNEETSAKKYIYVSYAGYVSVGDVLYSVDDSVLPPTDE